LGWGIVATWWVGAILGVLLAVAARAGSRPKLPVAALLSSIGKLLLLMAESALLFGFSGIPLGAARDDCSAGLDCLQPYSVYPRTVHG